MALCLVQPITGGVADYFLSHVGHILVSDVDKLLQRCGVAQVSEVEAKTFSEHLKREGKNRHLDGLEHFKMCLTQRREKYPDLSTFIWVCTYYIRLCHIEIHI